MKKIIVAGAGHAGLVAAALLAENGFDVTVIEKNPRSAMGHDWEDRFDFSLLSEITGKDISGFPEDCWRYRGDCAFISPSKRKKIEIFYDENSRQKVMWRKPLLDMLIDNAEEKGAKILFETQIFSPVCDESRVKGVITAQGEITGDIVIDSAGVFSPVKMNLPDSFGIDKEIKRGDLFYAWRAYFNKVSDETPKTQFEVYLYHECEQGLSWCCTNKNTVDILIGRIDEFGSEKIDEQLAIFRKDHPWTGDKIINGGQFGIIPVRRPLTLMVANGYAAAGDSAFMTTPMNGMGIDLSLNAGRILAETLVKNAKNDYTADVLWKYNRRFHIEYGAAVSKNEGLKNALLSIPSEGVDFLFENDVIQSADLSGAGKNMDFKTLMGKFARGMKKPEYFFAIVNGLIKGGEASSLYAKPPVNFEKAAIEKWSRAIGSKRIEIL
ncbi:MAG: NAD(P)-binding protein [Clostridiales bacterium]|nr:NAD(P)-binding protein [Clostridiales bacterium]